MAVKLKTAASKAATAAANNARITAANTRAGATVAQQNAANASALASMNQVRTSQGLAPQTEIGVPAAGRTNGALSIDKTTNEIKDASGTVVGKGSSLQDALAKQTQLSSGAAPTVAGRPDLFAVAPGANQKVESFMDAYTQNGKTGVGTGTMVNPKTATAEQIAAQQTGTLDSFTKAQGLTYLDGETFTDLQKDLNESDLIRDPSGRIFLRQGLTPDQVRARAATSVTGTSTGVTGGTTASEFTVDVPDTITTDTITEMMETPVTETDFNNMLAGIQVKQAELLALMTPGADEQATKAQIIDIKAQVEKSLTELSMGLNNVEDQPIAMQFITGQSASIQRSAEAKLQNLARIEANLLNELGLEQEARAVKASVAQTQLGYLQTNLDTAFKVKQMIQQEEDSIFNRARALKSDAQATFATILDTMKGIKEEDMSAEQQKQLQDMSIAAGIPYSLVVAGLKNIRNGMEADAAKAGDEMLSYEDRISLGVPFGTTKAEAAALGLFDTNVGTGETTQSTVTTEDGIFRQTYSEGGYIVNSVKIGESEQSAEKMKLFAGVESGIRSLEAITAILQETDPATNREYNPRAIFASGSYKVAETNLVDIIGRLRSGGAVTEDEEARFLSLLPGRFSSSQTVKDSLAQLNSYLLDFGTRVKPALSDEERKFIIDGGGDPDAPTFNNVGGDTKKASDAGTGIKVSQGGSPLEVAKIYLGLNAGNPKQARTLSAFFKKAGGVDIDPATTAWCAAFLNSVLGASGIKGTGSLMAQSFLKFGTTVSKPTKGDIVVFERGAKGSGQGHVGIITAINENGSLQVLGGNQSNKTSIETFKTSRVLGYRRITQAVVRRQLS